MSWPFRGLSAETKAMSIEELSNEILRMVKLNETETFVYARSYRAMYIDRSLDLLLTKQLEIEQPLKHLQETMLSKEECLQIYNERQKNMVDVKQEIADKVVQERQTQEQLEAELRGMLLEVKRKLKGESKNELLRIIGALLLDNYSLKLMVAEAQKQGENNENSGS